jgi:hypothetical protein
VGSQRTNFKGLSIVKKYCKISPLSDELWEMANNSMLFFSLSIIGFLFRLAVDFPHN